MDITGEMMKPDVKKSNEILQILLTLEQKLNDPAAQSEKLIHILRARELLSSALKGTFIEGISTHLIKEMLPLDCSSIEAAQLLVRLFLEGKVEEYFAERVLQADLGL